MTCIVPQGQSMPFYTNNARTFHWHSTGKNSQATWMYFQARHHTSGNHKGLGTAFYLRVYFWHLPNELSKIWVKDVLHIRYVTFNSLFQNQLSGPHTTSCVASRSTRNKTWRLRSGSVNVWQSSRAFRTVLKFVTLASNLVSFMFSFHEILFRENMQPKRRKPTLVLRNPAKVRL